MDKEVVGHIYIYIYIYTHIHTYNEILFSHKIEEILLFLTRMGLKGIMLSEISETKKDKYCMISLICGI